MYDSGMNPMHPVPTTLTEDGMGVLIKPRDGLLTLTPSEARELALKLESMADKAERAIRARVLSLGG